MTSKWTDDIRNLADNRWALLLAGFVVGSYLNEVLNWIGF